MTKTEVLIVGAGPTGLMAACQLAIRKIPFRIIDKSEDHTTQSRALVIHARSLEIFAQMGIAEEALQEGKIAKAANLYINGKRRLKVNFNFLGEGLTQFPFLLVLEQWKIEILLNKFINAHGIFVERNTELTNLVRNNGIIHVSLKQKDKTEETTDVNWIIGADGANSIVRRKLNIDFSGRTYKESLFVLDCESTMDFSSDEMVVALTDKSFGLVFPMAQGRSRVIGIVPDEFQNNEIVTFENVSENFALLTKLNIRLRNPNWISMYRSHHRSVSSFREGHCFLAGDAAHIHSPVGAQGMNTGLQDAYNLVWKLSMVINEGAKDSLLDSYNDERIVIAQNLVKTTDRVFNIITSQKKSIIFFRLYFLPFISKLFLPIVQRTTSIRRNAFKTISEIGLHYRYSKLSGDKYGREFAEEAPKPGDRVPYLPAIQSLLNGTMFQLLFFTGSLNEEETNRLIQSYDIKFGRLIMVRPLPFNISTKQIYQKFGIKNQGYYLIRPDNYIAFRTNSLELQKIAEYINENVKALS